MYNITLSGSLLHPIRPPLSISHLTCMEVYTDVINVERVASIRTQWDKVTGDFRLCARRIPFGVRHALYFFRRWWRQYQCVFGPYNNLRYPADGQIGVLPFPDKSGTCSPTSEGWNLG